MTLKTTISRFNNRRSKLAIVITACLILFSGAYLWWARLYATPEAIFAGMLDNNLKSSGFTRTIKQTGQNGSLVQTMQVSLGEQAAVQGQTVLTQPAAAGGSIIKTETIGSAKADYLRYSEITAKSSSLDLSKILNVWGKKDGGRFLQEALLGVIPFGNVDEKSRQKIAELLIVQGAYKVNYKTAVKTRIGGQSTYTYEAELNPYKYALAMQEFIKAMRLGQIDEFNPDSYKNLGDINLKVTVGIFNRQLVSVAYPGQNREEIYSGQGLIKTVKEPDVAISLDELQSRLQNIR